MTGGTRALLSLAAIAVALAAADTYVVVLALPDMMGSTGVPIDQLQRAAPILSCFLLGQVVTMPLVGRIADLQGRIPVLALALAVFAIGSLVTTLAYDVGSMAVGRFLQGVGGGALVPVTLALVADLHPARRRAVPLGIVSGVHMVAQVLGPLFGAVVLTVADWRAIFALNLAVVLVLVAALRVLVARHPALQVNRTSEPQPRRHRSSDVLGAGLGLVALLSLALVLLRPAVVMRDLFWGRMFVPLLTDDRWLSPAGLTAIAACAFFAVRLLMARRPLVDVRPWWRAALEADLVGSALATVALGGVILAGATAAPGARGLPADGQWYLLGAALAALCLVIHLRRAAHHLIPRGVLRQPPARGALLVSFLIGAALIAALVHIPLFARTTIHGDSPLMVALVLLRLLVAVPVGAAVGGRLSRTWGSGPPAALGMVLAAASFASMTQWGFTALEHGSSSVVLVVCGVGFGLALGAVNAAVLAVADPSSYGLRGAVVVARTTGMVVGVTGATVVIDIDIDLGTTVFAGAAVLTLLAALTAIVMFRTATPARTRTAPGLGFET